MELKELMKKLEISQDYIIEAAEKINGMCKRCTCKECPLSTEYGCVVTTSAYIRVGEVVKKRIQELLCLNHMEKVAEMLGVKLGSWFIATNTNSVTSGCHLTENGLYNDKDIAVPGLLADLLTGRAYIMKEENKDE